MRLVIEGEGSRVFKWITTRSVLRPENDDGFAYATPFAVVGRGTREVVAEFGDEAEGWSPPPGGMYRLRLESVIHPEPTWVAITTFDRGRLPVAVEAWRLEFGNGVLYDNPTDPRNFALPPTGSTLSLARRGGLRRESSTTCKARSSTRPTMPRRSALRRVSGAGAWSGAGTRCSSEMFRADGAQ
jgi:hypothetical protein